MAPNQESDTNVPNGTIDEAKMQIKIGVLALQGSFAEHISALNQLKSKQSLPIQVIDIRQSKDLDESVRGLIIPGGESTTLNKFLLIDNLFENIHNWAHSGATKVLWGTCAGLILLAKTLTYEKNGGQLTLGEINMTACRNYFGRQKQSFQQDLHLDVNEFPPGLDMKLNKFPGIFIRAPGVVSVDCDKVQTLATLPSQNGTSEIVVAVRQGHLMATSFHPELTDDLRFHQYFINMATQAIKDDK